MPLVHLMLDRYGNYVVQRMIEVSRGLQRHLLLALLLNELPVLLACSYGKLGTRGLCSRCYPNSPRKARGRRAAISERVRG